MDTLTHSVDIQSMRPARYLRIKPEDFMRRMWLNRLPDLLKTLRSYPKRVLVRPDIEKLFNVKKESALQIMRAASLRIVCKPANALGVPVAEILRLLEQIPKCPAGVKPSERRKWIKDANAAFAQFIAKPAKSGATADHKFTLKTSTTRVQIPSEVAKVARDVAANEGISLDEWVARTIGRELKKGTRSRRESVQDEPTLFPSDEILKTATPKS